MDFRPAAIAAQQGEDEKDQEIDFRPSAILENNVAPTSTEEIDFRPAAIEKLSAETLSPPESVVSQNPPVMSSSPLVDPNDPAGTGFGRAVQRGAVTTYAALPTMLATADARALADAQKTEDAIRYNEILRSGVPSQAFTSRAATVSDPMQVNQMMNQYGVSPQANVNYQQVVDKRLQTRQDAMQNPAPYIQRLTANTKRAGELFELAEGFAQSPTAAAYGELLAEAPDTFKGWLSTVTDDPIGFMAFMGETLAENVPQIAAGVATSLVTGNPTAGAAVMSFGGFSREYAAEIDSFLKENNIDLSKPQAASQMFNNPQLMDEANERGLTRGLVIAAADLAGQGLVAQNIIKNSLARQTAAQSFSEGAGEAAATAAVGDPFSFKETVTEALAGGGSTLAEGVIARPRRTKQPDEPQTEIDQPVAPPVDDTLPSTTATTQTDLQLQQPDQPVVPSAASQPNIEQTPPPVDAQTQSPELVQKLIDTLDNKDAPELSGLTDEEKTVLRNALQSQLQPPTTETQPVIPQQDQPVDVQTQAPDQPNPLQEYIDEGIKDGKQYKGVFVNSLEAKAKAIRKNIGNEAAEAYENAVKSQFKPRTEKAPELPNPQEADEVGTSTDDVVKSVQTPDGQKNYNVKGKVVELADLKQATGELQPRDRSRKESEVLSKQRAGTMFNPERLLDDPTSGSGAPIIARDGTIRSGNGRVLTLQEVYTNQPESLSKYRASLENAGINTEGFSQPVFVRQLSDDMTVAELKEFADLSNTEAQAQMSVTERAGRDAKRLTESKIIELYRGDFDIDTAQNRQFVQEYAKKILSPTEQGVFFDSKGAISQEGIARVKSAILGSAFDNTDTLATMLESSDENIKAISNAFMAAAPKFAQLKKQVADGRTEAQWDITPRLAEMANLISQLRRDGTKVQDYFNQTDMLSAPDPAMEALVQAFYNNDLTRANSTKAMKDFLDFYVEEALQKETGGLIADTTTPDDVIEAGKKRTEAKRNEGKGQQQGLLESNVERDETSSQQVQKQNVAQSRKDTRRRNEEADFDEINSATPNTDDIGTINSGSIFDTQSQTLRQSIYRDAFADSGIDVDAIENKSTEEKFKLLRKSVMDKFGLKNIEAPKEGAGYTQVNQLLDAYHNLQWMMHSLGLPNKAIGLEGSLSLSLPDRATRFLGAYMPGAKQVIMPQRSNSFAHEWAHALDYYILDKYGTGDPTKDIKGITGLVRRTSKAGDRPWLDRTPRNVQEAFGNLINALFLDNAELSLKIMQLEQDIMKSEARQLQTGKPNKTLEKKREQLRKLQEGSGRSKIKPTKFKEQSIEFGNMQVPNRKDYYKRPTEMFARAFEAYIAQSVEASGGNNEFITKGDAAYQMALVLVIGSDIRLAMTFPQDSERHNIMLAMHQLMEAIRTESIAEGTVADAPGGLDFIDSEATFMGEMQYEERASILSAPKRVAQAIIEDQKRAFRKAKNAAAELKLRPKKFTGDTLIERKFNEFKDKFSNNFINTKRQILFNIADRYNPKRNAEGELIKGNTRVKRIMEEIISGVATDPGSRQNRVTAEGGTFEEATRINSRRFYAVFDRINKEFDMDSMTNEELQSLRLLLTGEDQTTADASPRLLRLAGKLRREVLNPIYDYMVQSGQDINYVQDVGFMPRMLDVPLAMENPAQFKGELGGDKGAIPLYEQVIFDNEYGEYENGNIEQADQLVALARSKKLKGYVDQDFTKMANEIRDTVKQLLDLEKMLQKAEARGEPTADLQRDIDRGKAAIERTHKRLHEYLRRPFAVAAASDWLHRIQAREGADPSTNGSQGKFSQKRKLPGEADKYMNDFYLNATDAIMQYIPAAVRSTEYNKRFGRDKVPQGRKLDPDGNPKDYVDYLLEEAVMAGMKPHEAQEVRRVVNMVTGRHGGQDTMLDNAINTVNTFGTMSLLPRAVISSIAEPLTVGVQAGSTYKGLQALVLAFDGLGASLRGKNAVERKMYYSQLANILGVIDLPQTGEVMANRLGGMQAEDSKNAARLASFFLRTGLTNVTIAQRRASMRVGMQFIIEQAKQYRATTNAGMKEEARLALQDLGVRPEQMETFTEYATNLQKNRKGFYEIDQIMNADGSLTDMGSVLSVATNRFVDQSIQDPKIVDRPKWAENSIGRIVFGIQSFIAAFQRNVLEMAVKRGVRGIETRGVGRGTLRLARQSLLPLFSLYVGHTLVSAAREFIFNRDKWEEEKEEEDRALPLKYLATLGVSRSGFTGRLDPFVNSLYSLKYQSDFSNVLVGATGSYYLKALQRIFGLGIDNSPNTVSKEYQAARGTYDIAVPIIASWLTTLPGVGTTLGYGLGAADMALSSPTVKHYVVREFIKLTHGVEYRPGRSSSDSSGVFGKGMFD